MLCGTAEFDDFEPVGALEHLVANLGRLEHTVARGKGERLTLILIDQITQHVQTIEKEVRIDLVTK